MADNLNKEEEDLLQSALSDAFAPAPVTKVSTEPSAASSAESASAPVAQPPSEPVPEPPASSQEDWKAEYDEHLVEWRARNAEQRQKAEAERAKWEKLRAEKEKEGVDWKESILEERRKSLKLSESSASVSGIPGSSAGSVSGWESVRAEPESRASPSVVDARDLVTNERSRQDTAAPEVDPVSTESSPPTHSRPDSDTHEKWEEIPSEMASSFPSMTIPSDLHSPTSSHPQHSHRRGLEHQHDHGHHHHRPQEPDATATTAIFDTTLSTKTRALALFSSLAINLLLPFVNGVMLGFGEIFAKNVVVGWFGWKVPGSTTTNVGVRARSRPWKT